MEQEILNLEKQIERFIEDFRNLENSGVVFDREILYNNIKRISKE
jgi:hypothetical protein